jgi:methyl-accepting chemotaxis protein
MKQSIDNKIIFGFGFITLLLLGIGYYAYKHVEKINDLNKEILSTYEIISANQELLTYAVDIETAARGYMISGKAEYLEPLQKAELRYPDKLTILNRLASREPALQKDADSLKALLEARLEISKRYIDMRREMGIDSILKTFGTTGRGKAITDKIRKISLKIDQNQSGELRRLLRANYENLGSAVNTLIALIAVIIGTLLIVLILLRRDISGRIRAEKQLQDLNKDLEQKVEDRTEDLKRSFEDTEAKVRFRNLELEKQNRELQKRNDELENRK